MRLLVSTSTLLLGLGVQVAAAPAPRAGGTLSLVEGEDEFMFKYSTPDANEKNWIGVYHTTGGPDDEERHEPSLKWEYAAEGQGTLKVPAPVGARGKYKAYFLKDEGYTWLADPVEITAKGDDSGNPDELKIMTYNLWYGGTKVNDYHDKQVKFLSEHLPDIVGFQEATKDDVTPQGHAVRLAQALGWTWHQDGEDNSVGIISRHPIGKRHNSISRGSGIQINLNGDENNAVNFWSAHLGSDPYGPYDFCLSWKSKDEITKGEEKERVPQITEIVDGTKDQRDEADKLFILVGDFNAPSHLDWVSDTMSSHCDTEYEWPTSKVCTDAGLVDSFRKLYPNPKDDPGFSWSPVLKKNKNDDGNEVDEPQDRIDFIYGTEKLEVVSSGTEIAGEPKPEPDHEDNEWTSDHAAFITVYKMPKN